MGSAYRALVSNRIQSHAAERKHNIHKPCRQMASNSSRQYSSRSVAETRNFVGDDIIAEEMNDAERHQMR